jgi:glyoxylase-like metal-dependent hydrolase (beta-lactamase superfamily II)
VSIAAKIVAAVVAAVVVAALALAVVDSAAPLPVPPPLADPLPAASPPADMQVFQLPTGITHRTAAFAYRGGSFGDKRDFSMTAVLVHHPKGDILIDTGFGRSVDEQIRLLPLPFRLMTSYEKLTPAADQLRAAGYDVSGGDGPGKKISAILLTHAHWDHVSGAADLPGIPILVTPQEQRFISEGSVVMAVARSIPAARFQTYTFEGGPYLGFPHNHDVYGDGSIVIVPAPGHTPGSVVIFLAVPGGKRYALVGDLVWQLEGIRELEERPWLWRTLADVDPGAVRENIRRMSAIAQRFPEFTLVPAHDSRGFASMPTLSEKQPSAAALPPAE